MSVVRIALSRADIHPMSATAEIPHAVLPLALASHSDSVDREVFIELLTRVGCHVYSGEVSPDGAYREVFTGPGIEQFIGGDVRPNEDLTAAWNNSVHRDDAEVYKSAAVVDEKGVVQLEYRMIGRDGVTRWVLDQMWLRSTTEDGRRIIDGVVTDITSRKEAEIGMRRLAHSDSLTGLANRLQLSERIDAAMSELDGNDSAGIALLLLDLDGFKAVNDSFGHAIGDELLTMVARRLRTSVRPTDMPARLGGDEFAVLIERVDLDQAVAAAQRVLTSLSEEFVLSRSSVAISASIGLVHVADGRGSQDLMRDADVAMYRAKAEGKNRIVSFEPAMQARVLRRLELESDFRRGLDANELVLHYQPLVDLDTLKIVGVEALVRWQHPERGLLSPAEFIDVAEDTGMIVPLGRWVLEQATADAALWQLEQGIPLTVSVNLSPRQLHDPELVATAAYAIADAGIPPESLTIEITENLLLKDTELAKSRLAALRGLGIKVAVDDFGTGYSSLAYLDRYPVDILKIDRSFVEPLGESAKSAALVKSVIDLAAALEMETVAEGVENEKQRETLLSLGCKRAQGFFFARPLPAREIVAMLSLSALHD